MYITEKVLLIQAQSGDRQAAGRLYENYYQDIYTYLFYLVDDHQTVEKLCAEVFVRMTEQIPGYANQQKPFIHWLYTIARDLVNNRRIPETEKVEEIPGDASGEQSGNDAEAVRCFRKAIRHLKEPQQAVIVHRFVEGRSLADVADLLDENEHKLKNLQVRALQSLEKALQKEKCL